MGVSTLVFLMVTLFCCTLLCMLKSKRFKVREPIHARNFVLSAEEGTLVMTMQKGKEMSLPDPMEFPRENITFMDTVLGE